jgi:hypothetical protein
MKRRTKCIFTVQSCEPRGTKHAYNQEAGKMEDTGIPITTVTLIPWYSEDENHPNRRFWEATPSGDLQLFNVMNFDPPVGAEVEIYLEWDQPE